MAERPLRIEDLARPVDEVPDAQEDALAGIAVSAQPEAGIMDATQEYAKGLLEGVTTGVPAAGGVYGGARAGFQAGTRIPLGQPYTTVAATVLGGVTGLLGGNALGEKIGKQLYDEQTNPELKPFREAGKTTGGGISFLPLAYTIPAQTGVRVLDFLGKLGTFARSHPILYGAIETQSSIGSGIGAGAAEALAPGEALPRFAGEVAGGLLNPSKHLLTISMPAVDLFKRFISRYSKGQREARAANRLVAILEENFQPELRQTDPEKWAQEFNKAYLPNLLQALKDPGLVPGMTSAQKTGDLPLTMLQTALARQNDEFGVTIAEQSQKAQEAVIRMINLLNQSGDPTLLQEAATLRNNYLRQLLDSRLAAADAKSAIAIAGISKDSPKNRAAIGEVIRANVDNALKDAREVEHLLWTDVPKSIQAQVEETVAALRKAGAKKTQIKAAVARLTDDQSVVANNFAKQFEIIRGEMSPEYYRYEFPAIIKDIYERLSKAKKLEGMSEKDLFSFGKKANSELYKSFTDIEKQLSTLDKKDPSYASLQKQFGDTQKALLDAGKDFVRRGAINVGDLVNARRDMLRLAIDAEARGERANYAFYSKFSDALLEDMDQVGNPAYDTARAFSKELNDSFTRTFAGDMRAVSRTGAERILPEVLVSRAFSGNSDVVNARLQQIQDAVDMLPRLHNQYVGEFGFDDPRAKILEEAVNRAGPRAVSTADAVDRATRLAAADSIDPQTKRLNTSRLSRWLNENEALVNTIPGLRQDLENSIRAQNSLDLITNQNSAIRKKIDKQVVFTKLMGENPSEVVADALNSKNPALSLRRLAQAARAMGSKSPDMIDALKSAVYDYAYAKAGGDKLSFKSYNDAFFAPTSTGRPAMADILADSGIMTRSELANIKRLTGELDRIEAVMQNKQVLSKVLEVSDVAEDLVLRVAGARLGVGLASTGAEAGGSSLIAASAGSKAMREMLQRMPNESVRGLLEQATKDPEFMVKLLKKGRSEQDKIRFTKALNGYLINAGLTTLEEEEQPPPAAQLSAPQQTAAQIIRKATPTVPSRGLFGQAAPQRPQAQGQPNPQARNMLRQLFPFDPMLQ